jgi:hypothetical protein
MNKCESCSVFAFILHQLLCQALYWCTKNTIGQIQEVSQNENCTDIFQHNIYQKRESERKKHNFSSLLIITVLVFYLFLHKYLQQSKCMGHTDAYPSVFCCY